MRVKKDQLINVGLILLVGVFFLTPLGFHMRVFVSSVISFSPSVLSSEEQLQVTDFEWRLSSANGVPFDFETTRKKVVLINFWATWCPPCVAEMPDLQALYDDYKADVVFLFVAHDEREKVNDFLKRKDIAFRCILKSRQLQKFYLLNTYLRPILLIGKEN